MAATLIISFRDQASPALQQLLADVRNTKPMLTAASRGLANLLRDHFAEMDATRPNRMGWDRQHFWSDVRGTVQNPVIFADQASVSIDHVAFRQKLEGGEIVPVHGEFLTIPALDESYGKRAREFSDLKFGFAPDPETGDLRPALVAQRGTATYIQRGPRAKKYKAVAEEVGLVALFWLVRRVVQAATPGALPTEEEMLAAALAGAEEWAAAIIAQPNSNN